MASAADEGRRTTEERARPRVAGALADDDVRFASGTQYQQGWNSGFAKCKASHESNPRR